MDELIEVKESYDYIKEFATDQVPAALDLSKFPDGYVLQVELKIADSTDNKSKPIIESLELTE